MPLFGFWIDSFWCYLLLDFDLIETIVTNVAVGKYAIWNKPANQIGKDLIGLKSVLYFNIFYSFDHLDILGTFKRETRRWVTIASTELCCSIMFVELCCSIMFGVFLGLLVYYSVVLSRVIPDAETQLGFLLVTGEDPSVFIWPRCRVGGGGV